MKIDDVTHVEENAVKDDKINHHAQNTIGKNENDDDSYDFSEFFEKVSQP